MTLPVQRISLVTLGVDDLSRAMAFYTAWGWTAHEEREGMACFQLPGQALMLFGRAALAADQGRAGAPLGTGALTLAQNYDSPGDVDAAFAAAVAAGAKVLKMPEPAFWGGYGGYFSDPDGHVWELAHNPFWHLDRDGTLTLPVAP